MHEVILSFEVLRISLKKLNYRVKYEQMLTLMTVEMRDFASSEELSTVTTWIEEDILEMKERLDIKLKCKSRGCVISGVV